MFDIYHFGFKDVHASDKDFVEGKGFQPRDWGPGVRNVRVEQDVQNKWIKWWRKRQKRWR